MGELMNLTITLAAVTPVLEGGKEVDKCAICSSG